MHVLEELIGALRARWRIELLIFMAVMAAVLSWIWAAPRSYNATASLLYDVQTPQPISDKSGAASDDALLGTQADIIKSTVIASAVVREQNLATAPEVIASWRRATGGLDDINAWVGNRLLQKLIVVPQKGSRVLTIQYSSPSPDFAAQITNAFATTYMSERLRLQTDPARTYTRWFEDRTKDVRASLERAQGNLAAFKKASGIVDVAGQDSASTRLNELSTQLVGAEAQAADMNARARTGGAQSMEVQNSGVVQGLRAQIASKSAQISQLATVQGPNHPEIVAARAELGALQSKLSQEIGSSTRSLDLASGAASARASTMRAELNAQRGEMLSEVGDRSRLQILQRDVDSAQAAYDAVGQRLTAMRLAAEVPSTNVTQLDQAKPPLFPASPNVPLIALLGILLGTMLAAGAAIALEFQRPRVRTLRGLREVSGVPVLARVSFARPGGSTQPALGV